MAYFTGPKHAAAQAADAPRAEPAPCTEPTPRTVVQVADPLTWFDSSWELRHGLEVSELDGADELLPEWRGRFATR